MELHLNLLHRIIFFFLKASRIIQDILSQIFWKLIGVPLTYLASIVCPDGRRGEKYILFKEEKFHHKVLWKIYDAVMWLNHVLNGLRSRYISYQLLLQWNPNIPIIALKSVETTWTIERIGKKHKERNGHPVLNLNWLGTSKKCGEFKIIDKRIKEVYGEDEVVIDCIWLSGKDIGKKFPLTKHGSLEKDENKYIPDSIYVPPKIIYLIFDVIVSLSALTALIEFSIQAWKLLNPFLSKTYIMHLFQ